MQNNSAWTFSPFPWHECELELKLPGGILAQDQSQARKISQACIWIQHSAKHCSPDPIKLSGPDLNLWSLVVLCLGMEGGGRGLWALTASVFAVVLLVLPWPPPWTGCLGREGLEGTFPLAHQELLSLVESPGEQGLLFSLLTKSAVCFYAVVIGSTEVSFSLCCQDIV